MYLKVKKIAWAISLVLSLVILFTRCQHTPAAPPEINDLAISGKVTRAGSGAKGVELRLTGDDSTSVLTDSTGAYKFTNLGSGLYRVVPLRSGFTFNPGSHNLELTTTAAAGQDFVMLATGAQLVLLNKSLDFGPLFIGNSKTINLVLSNLGSATLTVSQLTFSSGLFTSTVTSISLDPDSLAYIPILFTPVAAGTFNATLTITSSDSVNPTLVVNLSGSASVRGKANIEAKPTSLSFGPVRSGNSANQKLTLNNTGTDTLKILSMVSSDSAFKFNQTQASLPPGVGFEMIVTFWPEDTLQHNAQLTVTSNAANAPSLAVPMTGSGFTNQLSGIQVSPTSLDFGRVFLDSTVFKTLTITNTGRDTLIITAFQFGNALFSSQFSGDLLAPGQSRGYTVIFKTAGLGTVQSQLTIYNSDPLQTRLQVPLKANVTTTPPTEIRINPDSLQFGQVQSSKSLRKWIYVVNPTAITLTVSQLSASPSVFRVVNSVYNIASHDSTRIEVEFAPNAVGPVSGVLQMSTNVLGRDSVQVPLSGEGTVPPLPAMQISQSALDFGSVVLGSSSSYPLTFTNAGVGELSITSLSAAPSAFSVSSPNLKVTAGNSGNVQVVFSPTSLGLIQGTLTVVSNDPTNPSLTVKLTGAAVDTTSKVALMTLSTRFLDLGSSLLQLSTSRTFVIGNLGKDTLRVTGINPVRSEYKALPNKVNVAPGGQQTIIVTFTPLIADTANSAVVILSNDQLRPVDSLNVTGVGLNPDSSVVTTHEVFIPGGLFDMGKAGEFEPVRRITLTSFYMDAYEVTNQEYKQFVDAGGYDNQAFWTAEGWQWRQTSNEQNFKTDDPKPMYWGSGSAPWESDPYSNQPNSPVIGVNWFEASAYAKYRAKTLPSEAQWEYVTRGQAGRVYPWGDNWDGSRANHGQSHSPYFDESDGYRYCSPIGSFPSGNSPEGVNNLVGNVMEWINDWNGDYNPEQTFNPTGNPTGTEKVIRGGSWRGSTLFARGFHRNRSLPKLRYPDCGIRLVRNF
ncbi:choice-of-anchor D domain-containing protein [bacterium]|nr:choice-of-anchor D domain-containing protein [bacterium]